MYHLSYKPTALGEHKAVIKFSDGTKDFVVMNVMDKLDRVIDERVAYICDELYEGKEGNPPFAFKPVSNQGESLGKLNLVLKKNLLGSLDVDQVRKVEKYQWNMCGQNGLRTEILKNPVNYTETSIGAWILNT